MIVPESMKALHLLLMHLMMKILSIYVLRYEKSEIGRNLNIKRPDRLAVVLKHPNHRFEFPIQWEADLTTPLVP